MNIPGLTDQSIKDMHTLIGEVLVADDALPAGKKAWGVRQFPDWKEQADAFETEMTKRGLPFNPIKW